jgi:spermidine/putrescine transport system permease protein
MTTATAHRGTRATPAQRVSRWFSRNAIRVYAAVGFSYLFIPVAYTFVYSFNDSRKSNLNWRGFTWEKWANPCGAPDVCPALVNSLKIGFMATVIATILGTMVAFALARHRFRGRTATNLTIFLPMATPEVVMGASLLALFLNMGLALGTMTIVIAHVMFCISFVIVTVKARLASLDPRLEQAAMDLYANELQTFRRITLPLAAPGIMAGALLAFSLSFDDFIITNFNSGDVNTFPKFVWVSSLRGIPAQANVIASAMFFLAFAAVVIGQLVAGRRKS